MADTFDFSGTWHSKYQYFQVFKEKQDSSEHDVKIHQAGNQLVIQSLPNDEGSYLLLRLTLDGKLLTGTWHEQSSPDGPFKGKSYYGGLQLVVDDDGQAMRGKWVGQDTKLKMQCGDWEVTRKKD